MAKVELDIVANTKQAAASIKAFGSQAESAFSGINSTLSGLKIALGAAAGFLAGRAIVGGIEAVIEAASKQEDAVNALNSSLVQSGEFSAAASKDIQDFAAALEETTTFGDEVILQQFALAKSFGATNDQAKLVTQAAIELAARQGKSLDEATRQIAKTMGGFAGELGEVNTSIKALTKEQLRNGDAARILLKEYEGSALAKTKTYSGAIEQLKNTYGTLLESLGSFITENGIVISVISQVKIQFSNLTKFIEQNREAITKAIGSFLTFGLTLADVVVKGISFFARGLIGVNALLLKVAEGITTLIASVLDFSVVASALGVIGVDADKLGVKFGSMAMQAKRSGENLKDTYEAIVNGTEAISGTFDEVKKSVASTNKFIVKDQDSTANILAKKIAEEKAARIEAAKESAKKIVSEFEGLEKQYLNFADNEIDTVRKTEKNRLDIIERALKDRLIEEKRAVTLREKVEKDAQKSITAIQKKEAEDRKRLIDEQEKAKDDVALIKKGEVETIGGAFGSGAGGIVSSIASVVNPIGLYTKAIETAIGVVQGLIDFLPKIINAIANVFNSLTDLPLKLLEAFQNLFGSITKFIREFIPNLLKSAVGIIREAFTFILKDLPQAFIDLFRNLGPLIKDLLKDLPDLLVGLLDNLPDIVSTVVISLVEAIPDIIFALIDSLITKGGIFRIAVAYQKAVITLMPRVVLAFYQGIAKAFQNIFPDFGRQFSDEFKKMFSGLEFPKIELPRFDFTELRNIFTGRALIDGLNRVFSAFDFFSKINAFFQRFSNLFQLPPFLQRLEQLFREPKFLKDLKTILDEGAKAVRAATGQGKGGGKGVIAETAGRIGSALGFAEGGQVPAGFPNDTFPARLTSGEAVIDRTDNARLSKFLDSQEKKAGDSSQAQTIVIQLKVGESQLADVMYQLSRKGFRTA